MLSGHIDPKIEALMAKLHSSVVPHASHLHLQSLPKVVQKASLESQQSSTDIGRVVQWAGQELALRDSKVSDQVCEPRRDDLIFRLYLL